MSAHDLCALAERVLGLRCSKHKRAERYSLRAIKRGRHSGPGEVLSTGLTRDDLVKRILLAADRWQAAAIAASTEAREAAKALPAEQQAQRDALERRQAQDADQAAGTLAECEARLVAAKALLAEVQSALGEVAK